MNDHNIEADVIKLGASYKYLMDVVEKTSVQVDSIQHQTNKIPLLIQRHDDFLVQMGEMKEAHKALSNDHYELKNEFKSWLNKGLGGWVVVAVVWSYIYTDFKDKWAEVRNDSQAAHVSTGLLKDQVSELNRRLKDIEDLRRTK